MTYIMLAPFSLAVWISILLFALLFCAFFCWATNRDRNSSCSGGCCASNINSSGSGRSREIKYNSSGQNGHRSCCIDSEGATKNQTAAFSSTPELSSFSTARLSSSSSSLPSPFISFMLQHEVTPSLTQIPRRHCFHPASIYPGGSVDLSARTMHGTALGASADSRRKTTRFWRRKKPSPHIGPEQLGLQT